MTFIVPTPLPMSAVDPDEVRDAACDITASAEVCSPPAPTVDEPTVISPSGSGGGGFGGAGGLLLVVLLVAALLVALAWLVRFWLVSRDDDAVDDDDDGEEDGDEDLGAVSERRIDEEQPPDRWRRRASEHRAAGRHRDAIRCEYRALVGDLAREGLVDEIPGRTSGEEREQIRALAPDSADDFDAAATLFDVAWFGAGNVGADDDGRFLDRSAAVLRRSRGERVG